MPHGAAVENIVSNSNLYAKFNDDRLWNEKGLVDWKSDNNNPVWAIRTTFVAIGDPFLGPKVRLIKAIKWSQYVRFIWPMLLCR